MTMRQTAPRGTELRAAIYSRVSREEQVQGYSLDAQTRACREYAATRGWMVMAEYREEGRSARTDVIARRPEFRRLLDDVRAGLVDVVLVHKVDRFARNVRIAFEALDLLGRAGVAFVSVTENVDYTTAQGRVFLGMLALFAQFYSDNLGQEVKKGKQERKAQGLYNGLLPFGYTKDTDGLPVPDPETSEGVHLAFARYLVGASDRDVAQLLNERGYRTAGNMGPETEHGRRGGNPFTKDTVRGMLQNRFYTGELPDGHGGWVAGRHPTLIAPELFQQVQEARERRRTAPSPIRRAASTYSMSALMRCRSCGGRMQVTENWGGRVRYYCRSKAQNRTCTAKGTYLDVYERQVLGYLGKVRLPDDYQERIMALVRELRPAASSEAHERQELEARLERTKRLYQWGDIAEDEYRATKTEITRRLRALTPETEERDRLAQLRAYLDELPRAWEDATQEQRNRLLRVLLETIWVANEKVVAVRPRPEFQPLFSVWYDSLSNSAGSGDPDGSRGRVCHFHRLVRWRVHWAGYTTRCAIGARPGKLSPSERAAAADRVLSGAPLRDVAMHFGVSHETLRRALRQEGIITSARLAPAPHPPRRERAYRLPGRGRSRAITPEELADLVIRLNEGESIRSLARSVGVSHETLRRSLAAVAGI
jgi:site-specific DNA recombinase